MKKIVAFATNDGNTFMDRHFGDAEHFDIYEIDEAEVRFLKRIDNTTEDEGETGHAVARKAGGIAALLKQEKVSVAVSKVFGPNLKRIKSKFVCVLMKETEIAAAAALLQSHLNRLDEEWEKGEDRNFLRQNDLG